MVFKSRLLVQNEEGGDDGKSIEENGRTCR
jgi:hypothetical protein